MIICFLLWIFGRSLYRGWRRREQQELVTTLSHSASVAFANSDGIPPPISEFSPVNSPISGLPTDNSPINSPICELSTDNSPVMPSDDFYAILRPFSVMLSALPIEECDVYPSQFVCPCCGNMWPVYVV
ncbi:hypothetical protein D8674_030543 [Pyrus ussuriensis x Pyrus communis]|uniref:Uncharacterized protein n=1 Tax=Pyrus ussuriensis x Pyrus communis TaxID=2448454 RepID=A0A5N5EX26_9ROSA|nr:hypothetical protein D8674_030543 [Pyrus ussuriensis x Pyrus communis]